jgi:hypothetical protein
LDWLGADEIPERANLASFRDWVARDGFRDGSVFHQHYAYSPELADLAAAIPAHLATIVRNPYDQFVSFFFFVQTQADNAGRPATGKTRTADAMIGKPIDDPVALEYLERGFGADLRKGVAWVQSGRSVVVRYEALHEDPTTELVRATNRIAPVDPGRITAAIRDCEAQNLLRARKGLRKRIRTATVGDWRNHLSEPHLALFREHHGELIRLLGYEVA